MKGVRSPPVTLADVSRSLIVSWCSPRSGVKLTVSAIKLMALFLGFLASNLLSIGIMTVANFQEILIVDGGIYSSYK